MHAEDVHAKDGDAEAAVSHRNDEEDDAEVAVLPGSLLCSSWRREDGDEERQSTGAESRQGSGTEKSTGSTKGERQDGVTRDRYRD